MNCDTEAAVTNTQEITDIVNELRRVVDVQSSNFSVRELARMVAEGELNISPEYQRLFRWDNDSESRLIESLMLGLPVPSVFVATNPDFTLEVVDGLQRLSTLVHFLDADPEDLQRIGKGSALKLSGLETIPNLNGYTFTGLPRELQLYFSRTTLQVTALTDKSDYDVRFELFDRLNAGSLRLTNQEVRNAVYRGRLVTFLREMARLGDFRSMLHIDEERMRDGTPEETILKFFAYRHDFGRYRGPIKPFLNQYMKERSDQFPEERFRQEFQGAVTVLKTALGDEPYLRAGYHQTPMVPFEAFLLAAAKMASSGDEPRPKAGWKEDKELREVSGGGHNTPGKLAQRIARAEALLRGAEPVVAAA